MLQERRRRSEGIGGDDVGLGIPWAATFDDGFDVGGRHDAGGVKQRPVHVEDDGLHLSIIAGCPGSRRLRALRRALSACRRMRYVRGIHNPAAFTSAHLPTEHFDERFSEENLRFWVPLLIELAEIGAGQRVLDVGCGTGGFARAIAETASAIVTGIDYSERFIVFARELPPPGHGAVEWKVGSAEALAVADGAFDRVLLSLVLHQLERPQVAVAEAYRSLTSGGLLLVRTIAPADVSERVPEQYVPAMARADADRMPPLELIERWLAEAGFTVTKRTRVLRNKKLNLADEERQLLVEARSRYAFISSDELEEGLRLMHADAQAHGADWVDPRPTHFITATKPAGTTNASA
jgi:ubiquinone/menaquinone biosynthesis C-methylase UbiE